MAAAFDLTANGMLKPPYPQPSADSMVRTIPPSLLKAVGWVESNWRQFTPQGGPLVSFDFGYGIMQITSGMAGAFGKVDGDLDTETQSRIASDYVYNIAYGARLLAYKWQSVPQVGNGDPRIVENWYYALWAYNGWGWVNNPNNPRFRRIGTPATNPTTFPYQERVLYLVAHPPKDSDGNPLWRPVNITLPARKSVGRQPGPLPLTSRHRQDPPRLSAVYSPSPLRTFSPGSSQMVTVRLVNTGIQPWFPSGPSAIRLGYHLLTAGANVWRPFSPYTDGILAFGQGTVSLNRSVLPGESDTVRIQVIAPTTPGTYKLAWDLEQGAGAWFSSTGVPVRALKLRVLQPGRSQVSSPAPTATPTSPSTTNMRYVADTSVPDGSTLHVRQRFVKGWLVFNSGRLAWPDGSTLQHVSGPAFGARSVPVPPVRACRSANLMVNMSAPAKAGNFTGSWQMRDANGKPFGDRLTVAVTVKRVGTGTPTPTPSRPPPPPSRPTPTPTATPVG